MKRERGRKSKFTFIQSPWHEAGRRLVEKSIRKLMDSGGLEEFLSAIEDVDFPFEILPNRFDPVITKEFYSDELGIKFGKIGGLFWRAIGETPFAVKNKKKVFPLGKNSAKLIAPGIPLTRVNPKIVRLCFGSYCVRLYQASLGRVSKSGGKRSFSSPMRELVVAWLGLLAWDNEFITHLGFARWAWAQGLLRPLHRWTAFKAVDPFPEDLEFGFD